jgi:hypothetical protein
VVLVAKSKTMLVLKWPAFILSVKFDFATSISFDPLLNSIFQKRIRRRQEPCAVVLLILLHVVNFELFCLELCSLQQRTGEEGRQRIW